jgi:hypothetical protein
LIFKKNYELIAFASDVVLWVTVPNAPRPPPNTYIQPGTVITRATVQSVTALFEGFADANAINVSPAFNSALNSGLSRWITANPDPVTRLVVDYYLNMSN